MLILIESEHHDKVFRMEPDLRGGVKQWIEENCSCGFEAVNIVCKPYRNYGWSYRYYIEFPNEADAMLFKLKWL